MRRNLIVVANLVDVDNRSVDVDNRVVVVAEHMLPDKYHSFASVLLVGSLDNSWFLWQIYETIFFA